MNITLSPELEKMGNEKVQSGEFEGGEAVAARALGALPERGGDEPHLRQTSRDKIDQSMAQAERGEFVDGKKFSEHPPRQGERLE